MLYDEVKYWSSIVVLVFIACMGIIGAAIWHSENSDAVGSFFVLVVAGLCAAILGSRFFR